jgi:hypothetical protein
MRESETRLHEMTVDLIEETEFDGIGGLRPQCKVGAIMSESGAKKPRICR